MWQIFLELKALMELEERIDYTFERDLLIAKDYYPSNIVPIIIDRDNKLELKRQNGALVLLIIN